MKRLVLRYVMICIRVVILSKGQNLIRVVNLYCHSCKLYLLTAHYQIDHNKNSHKILTDTTWFVFERNFNVLHWVFTAFYICLKLC